MSEGRRLSDFSRAVRTSSLKRLRAVPSGYENYRPTQSSMSFADLAQHLIDADAWLLRKLVERDLDGMTGAVGLAKVETRKDYVDLLSRLEQSGSRRASRLEDLSEKQLSEFVHDNRFEGEVSVWWVVVRGNLDHEIHHRGQIAERLRNLPLESREGMGENSKLAGDG
jgi:uncharacterized damage-inducible protein DinB